MLRNILLIFPFLIFFDTIGFRGREDGDKAGLLSQELLQLYRMLQKVGLYDLLRRYERIFGFAPEQILP